MNDEEARVWAFEQIVKFCSANRYTLTEDQVIESADRLADWVRGKSANAANAG